MNATQKLIILRRRRRREQQARSLTPWLRVVIGAVIALFLSSVLLVVAGVGTAFGVYAYIVKDLPDPEQITVVEETFENTKFYDRTGQHLIFEVVNPMGDRTWVPLDEIPLVMREATIAIEDKTFYENPGVDLVRIFSAAWSNIRGGTFRGGSTLTMQLVKNVLIPPEERYKRSYARKIKEVILAFEITRRYPGRQGKDKILEWYLNTVFYGNLAYGVEAASQVYFGKHVSELNLAEAAMLAALPQSPGLNPIDNPEEARKRQHVVLDAMALQGRITWDEARAAKWQPLHIRRGIQERYSVKAPHFSLYALDRLEEIVPPEKILRGGLRVYTTIDLDLQEKAEQFAREHIAKLQEEERNVSNAAVVVIRPRTGEILAMVGSLDYWNEEIDGEVNCAIANRQPGSSFKPFTYVTAFAQGYTPATMVLDVRTTFLDPPLPPYTPMNYDRKWHGPQSLRTALARSLNCPAVQVLDWVGVGNVIKTAHRMGITTLNKDLDYYGLSLTLGGGEVKLLDMTYAFSVFASGGVMYGVPRPPEKLRPGYRELDPVAILRVEDRDGNILWQYTQPEAREILSPQLAYLINDVLSDNNARAAAFGWNSPLYIEGRRVAAKTGTTSDFRDAWTIGYTPQICTGVWVGNTDNQPMEHVPGSKGAAPIWHAVMEYALKDLPPVDFPRPPGIVEKTVCAVSGLLPTEHCPVKKEIFIEGTEPTTYCNIHKVFRVNKETGKLATVYTPPELVEERVYEIYPPEAADWVREAGIPQPPTEYDDQYGPSPTTGPVAIISPKPYAYISHGVVIIGNAMSDNFSHYRLTYGQGLNPSAWTQIGGDHPYQVNNGPLDYWDVSGLDGLYTLQLTVVRHDQSYQQASIQVTVDNISPTVNISYPPDGKVYVMEDDEWVNIQADAQDNVSMDRVEFYLDDRKIAVSTVPPFNEKWTIVMSDIIPIPGLLITRTEVVVNPDGSQTTQVVTVTQVVEDEETGRLIQYFPGGMAIISDTHGYTETHLIHVVAYDAAGNRTESEKVRIFVIHKPEPKKAEGESYNLWRDDKVVGAMRFVTG